MKTSEDFIREFEELCQRRNRAKELLLLLILPEYKLEYRENRN